MIAIPPSTIAPAVSFHGGIGSPGIAADAPMPNTGTSSAYGVAVAASYFARSQLHAAKQKSVLPAACHATVSQPPTVALRIASSIAVGPSNASDRARSGGTANTLDHTMKASMLNGGPRRAAIFTQTLAQPQQNAA